MRFMVMVRYVEGGPDDVGNTEETFAAMARYNEELVKAGVLLTAEGLHPTETGALVRFTNGEPTVVDGPFSEAKEVVGGYWILEVKSREEAIEWVKRVPASKEASSRIEIRQMLTNDDFEAMTPELAERHERMAEQIKQQR